MQNPQTDLVLLTQKFPYESGEEFIGNEITFLARHFNKVYLIPTLVRDFSKARDLPSNVEIVQIKNPTGPLQIAKNFICHLPGFLALFSKELKSSGLDFYTLKYLSYHIPLAIEVKNRIAALIQKDRTYSFYSYWVDTNAFALVLLKKKFRQIKFIVRTHNGDLYDERHPKGFVVFRKSIYEQASIVAPISNHGRQYIKHKWAAFANKTKTFHLGVKQQPIAPIPKSSLFRIVSCSSLIPIKRLDKIIEVISLLPFQLEWIHFGGSLREVTTLKKQAEKSLGENISFSPRGYISNAELMEFYRNEPCDVFINLSLYEGIPVSIMEATCFGLPIISNDVGGVKEIVGTETGILVAEDEEPKIISIKLVEFLESGKSRSQEFRERVYAFWKDNYNAEKNYNLFINEIGRYSSIPRPGTKLK